MGHSAGTGTLIARGPRCITGVRNTAPILEATVECRDPGRYEEESMRLCTAMMFFSLAV